MLAKSGKTLASSRIAAARATNLLPAGGLKRVELQESESCCGSAGIYSALRPKDAERILEGKLEALRSSGARTLVTANPGCQLQWQAGVKGAGLEVEVLHLAELLDRTSER